MHRRNHAVTLQQAADEAPMLATAAFLPIVRTFDSCCAAHIGACRPD